MTLSVAKSEESHPCDTYSYGDRMLVAHQLLHPNKDWPQINFVQSIETPKDPFADLDAWEVLKGGTKATKNRIAVSGAYHAVAAKPGGGKVGKHSEQYVLNHIEVVKQADGDEGRTLVILSTYSPCGDCGKLGQIQNICGAGTGAKYFKKCVYLYSLYWTGSGSSPATEKDWDKTLLATAGIHVYQCKLPVLSGGIEYFNPIPYDQEASNVGYGYDVGEYYDYRYNPITPYQYNYDGDNMIYLLSIGIGIMALIGICCFCMILSCITGYGFGWNSAKYTKLGGDNEDFDDDDNQIV